MSAKKKSTHVPTAAEMDGMLWAQGYSRWICDPVQGTTIRPHELDYLRGIHNAPVLTALSKWLSGKLSKNVRMRSMWQDKHVYVTPIDGAGVELPRRELADLAVIVNNITNAGIQRSMWILQAKVTTEPLSPFSGHSSKKEIELFEETDCFLLLDGKGSPFGRSYHAREFSGPKHWAFMTFHKNHRVPRKSGNPFPVMRRWPGSSKPVKPLVHSFCSSLLDVCKGNLGASVDVPPEDDEWSRLYRALLEDTAVRSTTGYAKTYGNVTGSVMQLAASALPGFRHTALAMTIRPGEPPRWLSWRGSSWPDTLFLGALQYGLSLCHGKWSGDTKPPVADDMLIRNAFGEVPPEVPPGERNASDEGDGPGFQQILFIDVWADRPGEPATQHPS